MMKREILKALKVYYKEVYQYKHEKEPEKTKRVIKEGCKT